MNNIDFYLKQIKLPVADSHKGQNGKLLIIGGSALFHAASKWSLDIASKFVDMVFYSSVPENNQLIREAKQQFWNGIVVERSEIFSYLEEADAVLIGPGMTRDRQVDQNWTDQLLSSDPNFLQLKDRIDWQIDTYAITNYLVARYPEKKWVIDAGALQMIEPKLLRSNHIITPHHQEIILLAKKVGNLQYEVGLSIDQSELKNIATQLQGVTILLKGQLDFITDGQEFEVVEGGNPGLTKGGTGDVLAGLVAALFCHHSSLVASTVGSYLNKKAGDILYQQVGPFFNASDLVTSLPQVFWQELQTS